MNQGRRFDPRLYLVVGQDAVARGTLCDLVQAAVRGGVTMVQLREKSLPQDREIALARELKALLAPLDVPLIINDHVEVARAADADGVHLGQDDEAPGRVRDLLGPGKILGFSAGNPLEAERVDPRIMDYVGVGPVYPTGSKADAGPAIGLEGLKQLRAILELPLVAIGGIGPASASEVMTSGVEGVAVVSAICGAGDPEAAARRLRAEIEG